jgi:hypothetical protein
VACSPIARFAERAAGAEMNGILPNLVNFNSADYPTNLGFMA